jgi:cytochrome c oxidase assembly protein subunit 11
MALSGPAKTVVQTVSVVILMGGLAWASVPFYDWFCRVTGFGGTPGQVAGAEGEVLDQTIKVRFDGSLNEDMPWEFKPVVNEMELRIGETGLTPYAAGAFFEKIECFCFTEQVLAPGERVQMPVSFFVDPEIVEDRDGKYVHTITLSYTFYEIDLPEDYEAPDQDSETNLN